MNLFKEYSKFQRKIPIILFWTLTAMSVFFILRAFTNYVLLVIAQFTGFLHSFILFGKPEQPSILFFFISLVVFTASWLYSTKYFRKDKKKVRTLYFAINLCGVFINYLWLVTAPIYLSVIPFILSRESGVDYTSVWMKVIIGDMNTISLTIFFIPTILVVLGLIWLSGHYSAYANELKEAFLKFELLNAKLQLLLMLKKTDHWPDVALGPETKSKELIIQPGRDRTLNNIIIGSIGTGKTAALVLPILNQDLHWMTKFINDFPELYERPDYDTEDVKGMYLNGISVIEPSNDLCEKVYKLVLAHGIPKESVFYIDPTNPNTPSINPMQGPVEKVAEAFAMVIEGLAEGANNNFFFQQSERNHLKSYIYLLKLHEPEKEVTFDMLLQMYDNPQLVRKMHEKLKETFPENYDLIEDRDLRNHWMIVKQIDEWFDANLLPKVSRAGGQNIPEKVTHGEYRGEDAYYDAKAEYVQGLRNILNDIGASPLIRRVLFGKSDFDFDRHLELGGVLLVNSAKGELGNLSNVLGKLILLSLQNAVFRRKPNVSPFHHILVDEFPDYVYRPFKEFPAQSRKYKAIVTVVAQTIAQLADKYGETYMHSLLGTLRHKMVYGDIPEYDAELFSKQLGEESHYEESTTETSVSALQESPMMRMGYSYQKVTEPILSPSDIIYQDKFQCAVKIVDENVPIPVRQINANFVPKEEFEEAIVTIDESAVDVWLDEWKRLKVTTEQALEHEVVLENESEDVLYVTPKGEGEPNNKKETENLLIEAKDHLPIDYPYESHTSEEMGEPFSTDQEPKETSPERYKERPKGADIIDTHQKREPVVATTVQPNHEEEIESFELSSIFGKDKVEQTGDGHSSPKSELTESTVALYEEVQAAVDAFPNKRVPSALYSDYEEEK